MLTQLNPPLSEEVIEHKFSIPISAIPEGWIEKLEDGSMIIRTPSPFRVAKINKDDNQTT